MRYAWKPDLPDHRDHLYDAAIGPAGLPDHIDPIGVDVPIFDQGQLGSCTGNATAAGLAIVTGSAPLSRLMAYFNGRAIEGNISHDSGCAIRDVVKGIHKNGLCLESLWPYDVSKFKIAPPAPADAEAHDLLAKISAYERVTTRDGLLHAIVQRLPVVFGFSVPEYFEGPEVAAGSMVRLPTARDKILGGHAVLGVGYDFRGPVPFVWVRNSWGATWGVRGLFKMDARWFVHPGRLVDDMWVFRPVAKA